MNVRSIDCTAASAAREFPASLRDTGFAVLENHPVPPALLARLHRDWSGFFSSAEKHDYRVDSGTDAADRSGFFPASQSETAVGARTKDLKEFYHVIADHAIPEACSKSTLEYRALAFSLGKKLCRWLDECTPSEPMTAVSEALSEVLSLEASLLRILHYPPLDGSESPAAVRAAAHEDINFLTLLPAASQPGLEVKDTAGRWHAVSCDANAIVVNAGDMLSEATAGYYPSTTHRVVNPDGDLANTSRISMPFFLSPRLDLRLSNRYTAREYLNERLRIINR